MIGRLPLATWLGAATMLAALDVTYVDGLRLNTTPSMPIGLWQVSPSVPEQLHHGSIVTVCLPETPIVRVGFERGYIHSGSCPEGLEPVVKPVAALQGDAVTVRPTGILVNGLPVSGTAQLARDSGGRVLNPMRAGVYVVDPGQVWVLAGRDRRSFDSRYFGPVPVSAIQAEAHPFWVLR